jgi:uncharacterized protein
VGAPRRAPQRTCVACRTERAKGDLVRVVRTTPGGDLRVDARGKASGRGAYLCADPACLERGLREGGLARALATTIDETARGRLRGELAEEISKRTTAGPRS